MVSFYSQIFKRVYIPHVVLFYHYDGFSTTGEEQSKRVISLIDEFGRSKEFKQKIKGTFKWFYSTPRDKTSKSSKIKFDTSFPQQNATGKIEINGKRLWVNGDVKSFGIIAKMFKAVRNTDPNEKVNIFIGDLISTNDTKYIREQLYFARLLIPEDSIENITLINLGTNPFSFENLHEDIFFAADKFKATYFNRIGEYVYLIGIDLIHARYDLGMLNKRFSGQIIQKLNI